jgi:drug/metabolite transporter (DMT)-like permease
MVVAFLRFGLAALLLLALGAHRRAADVQASVPRADRFSLALMGLVGFGAAKFFTYIGLSRTTATDAALIINMEAVFTALLAGWLLRQRLGLPQWSGIALAFLGGLALVWPDGTAAAAHARALGNLLLIVSVGAEALATILGARAMRHYTGLQVTAFGVFWGAATLLIPAGWQWSAGGASLAWATPANLAALAYLAVGPTVLAYVLWFRLLARVEAGQAAAFLYVQPVVGVLLGIALRGEWPTALGWAGGALVLVGVILASLPVTERTSE